LGLAKFARRIVGLQQVFPSSSQTIAYPDALDGTVSPVYPFPPPPAALARVTRESVASNVSVQPDITAAAAFIAGQDEWIEILYGHLQNNDGAAGMSIELLLTNVASQTIAIGKVVCPVGGLDGGRIQFLGAVADFGNEQRFPLRIWIPPGWRLDFLSRTGAAGRSFVAITVQVRHPLAEIAIFET